MGRLHRVPIEKLVLGSVCVCLGLSAGAMLTEAQVLVAVWQATSPAEFLAWFAAHEPRLVAFYAPLQIASTGLALSAAAWSLNHHRAARPWLATAALFCVAVLGLFFSYFRDVNLSFAQGSIPVAQVAEELQRWARWQWLRTACGICAFLCAVVAVLSAEPRNPAGVRPNAW